MMDARAWLDARLEGIADRWDRLAEAVSAPWYRVLDRIAGRWDRLAEAVSAPWYRVLDRIAGRWDRIAEAASSGWERVTWRVHARRRHHGERERRGFGFVDRIGDLKERFTESFFVGWDRLTNRRRGRGVRTARSGGVQSRRRVAGRIVAGAALTVIVGLASMVGLSALRDAGSERSAVNADLGGPGRSSDAAVEGPAVPEERPPASDGSGSPLGAFRVHRDERTGYRFSYPIGWEVSASERITRLVDAAGGIIISFRTEPSGSIEDFSERLMGILASRYAPLDLVAREEGESPQGEPSLVLGGMATDSDGSSFRFMIVTIEGTDRNRAVTVRFSADSNLLDVSSSIRRIVGSFTASALATAA
jgi:hypothetical protein